jgi:glycosyltransferase involved in cell wall biosynthesis
MKFINNIGYDKLIGISNDTIKEFKIFNHYINYRDILYYGITLNKFKVNYNKSSFFIENNLPENAILLLFIGRFTKLKNPTFLIDILYELYSQVELPFYVLFIGEGDEKKHIIQRAIEFDLIDKIRILGWVHDPEKYFKIADVFVFPRKLYPTEGFGIVMLEAQASGIQTIVSSGVSKETIVIDEIVTMINNASFPKEWANEILKRFTISHLPNSLALLESSLFNISRSSNKLVSFYENKA